MTNTFDGDTFDEARDETRLRNQLERVYDVMKDADWISLHDIAVITKDPESSISAQLRNLRKEKFGGHVIDRRYENGCYEYKLVQDGGSCERRAPREYVRAKRYYEALGLLKRAMDGPWREEDQIRARELMEEYYE